MNAISLTIMSLLSTGILFGSKRIALLSLLAGVLYLTEGQFLDIGGLTLYPIRVLVVVAAMRIVLRSEQRSLKWNSLDAVVLSLYIYSTTVYLLQYQEGQLEQVGIAVDALFLYFSFRALVSTVDDLDWILCGLTVVMVPYVMLLWYESLTLHNPFAAIGGVELVRAGDRWVREGRLRATGSFGHPSLLGTFGASFLPLYIGMALYPARRIVGFVGAALCIAIVLASNSGGPAMCAAAAIFAWLLWPIRQSMRFIRLGLVVVTIALVLFMNDPIWYVIARFGSVTGGDAYHRALLLDVAFQNIDKWWISGMSLRETAGWLPYTNTLTGNVDLTNTFLQFGLKAGLASMLLLIGLLVIAYKRLGFVLAMYRAGNSDQNCRSEYFLWGLGGVIFVHIVNWFAIAYWDQSAAVWFLHLALVGSLTSRSQIAHQEDPVEGSVQCV